MDQEDNKLTQRKKKTFEKPKTFEKQNNNLDLKAASHKNRT